MMKKRGCGFRVEGGCYATVPSDGNGSPIEFFLLDPPKVVDMDAMGVPVRHPVALPRADATGRIVYHVYDYVGQEFYPDLSGFVEEARRLGVSRRCELKDYSMLTADSRLVLLHPKAWIDNHADYYEAMSEPERDWFRCPKLLSRPYAKEVRKHSVNDLVMCSRLWWHDVGPQKRCDDFGEHGHCEIDLPCGASYWAYHRAAEIEPVYRTAIFGVFPLGHFEIVRDRTDGTHEAKRRMFDGLPIPFEVVDE